MCAIAAIINIDEIILLSDGYSHNPDNNEEKWDTSKIHHLDTSCSIIYMGYWIKELTEEISKLRGKPSEIAKSAMKLMRRYFDKNPIPNGNATKIVVAGFENNRPSLYVIQSENKFKLEQPIPPEFPLRESSFTLIALNGIDKNPNIGRLIFEYKTHYPELDLTEISIKAFKTIIHEYQGKGKFGGQCFAEILHRNGSKKRTFKSFNSIIPKYYKSPLNNWFRG